MRINCKSKNRGFTLIELMTVVAILAIIAAVALPSYQKQAMRGKRAEGKAMLLDMASRQERHYTQFSTYAKSVTGAGPNGLNLNTESENGHYQASIVAAAAGGGTCTPGTTPCISYTLRVTSQPIGVDTECVTLTLTSTGVEGSTGTSTAEECWR